MAKKKSRKAVAKKVAKRAPARKQAARRVASKRTTAPASRSRRATTAKGPILSVAPGFTVNDAEKSIAWYRDVLGFTVGQRWERDGTLLGAEMRTGDVTFNLGQDDWKMGRDRVKGAGVRMYITTGPVIDQLAAGIKARGGTLAHEPREEWGMRTFAIEDPDGYKITFMCLVKK